MLCSDIMERHVECIRPNDTVQQAAVLMREHDIGFLPVCDARGTVVGTLTDRDLTLRILAEGRGFATPVADVMTANVVSCKPDDAGDRAHQLMRRHKISRLVCVTEQGHLAGIISIANLATDDNAGVTVRHIKDSGTTTYVEGPLL